MFSTAGYFKGLPCPFFLSGLCERPYCHFKHSKPEEGNFSRNIFATLELELDYK
jgi:RNA exonuclease 1